MADGALGYHGFDFALQDALKVCKEIHFEAGGVLDHLCVDYQHAKVNCDQGFRW